MSKFNRRDARPAGGTSPVKTTQRATTALGGAGFERSDKSELFLLAVSNLVGEKTAHEDAYLRDDRFAKLVATVAVEDIDWLIDMGHWLRNEANMRSASTALAVHGAHARMEAGLHEKIGNLVDAVLQRPDEPGECAMAWQSLYGRTMPKGFKWGLGRAAQRLYNERAYLKWDGQAKAMRLADVLGLAHPAAADERQADLFQFMLDQRRHGDGQLTDRLTMLKANIELREEAQRDPKVLYDTERLRRAGFTWENTLSLGGELKLDKRRLWEAVIPLMPMKALVKNLRNFDEHGVSESAAKPVLDKLTDPEQVRSSRLFPFRFHTAYREAPSLRWGHALDQALTASLSNVPQLGGRTLILVDTSSSMKDKLSEESEVLRWDVATLFGVALGLRCASADVVSFSSTRKYYGDPRGAHTARFPLRRGESLLRAIDRWKSDGFFLGGGTDTALALRKEFQGHDRVVIVTDEQQGSSGVVSDEVPKSVPLYTWNLAGYKVAHGESGARNRHTFGGLADVSFRLIPVLEAGNGSGKWPWQI